jgi:hypothetical protein
MNLTFDSKSADSALSHNAMLDVNRQFVADSIMNSMQVQLIVEITITFIAVSYAFPQLAWRSFCLLTVAYQWILFDKNTESVLVFIFAWIFANYTGFKPLPFKVMFYRAMLSYSNILLQYGTFPVFINNIIVVLLVVLFTSIGYICGKLFGRR